MPNYSASKTIADGFRFRHRCRVGVNLAVEALRDAWRHQRTTIEALRRCAKICRGINVIRPYLESLA